MPRWASIPPSWRCPCRVGWRWGVGHEINFGKSLSRSVLLLCLFWLCAEESLLLFTTSQPFCLLLQPSTSQFSKACCALGVWPIEMLTFISLKIFLFPKKCRRTPHHRGLIPPASPWIVGWPQFRELKVQKPGVLSKGNVMLNFILNLGTGV